MKHRKLLPAWDINFSENGEISMKYVDLGVSYVRKYLRPIGIIPSGRKIWAFGRNFSLHGHYCLFTSSCPQKGYVAIRKDMASYAEQQPCMRTEQ